MKTAVNTSRNVVRGDEGREVNNIYVHTHAYAYINLKTARPACPDTEVVGRAASLLLALGWPLPARARDLEKNSKVLWEYLMRVIRDLISHVHVERLRSLNIIPLMSVYSVVESRLIGASAAGMTKSILYLMGTRFSVRLIKGGVS